ncbi:MAG: alpha-amylase family glycosyl hydrolase [Bacillota bacterium]
MPDRNLPPRQELPRGVMFNAYPDSIGSRLSDTVKLLKRPEFKNAFSLFYILPTFFNSDLDRGFSVIDYNLNRELVSENDLEELYSLGITLKLDFVLNHLSVNSPQFRDLLDNGDESTYSDFFIDWNKFWQNRGEPGPEGYIIPYREYLDKLFTRKPGLPVMKICFPDGTDRFFWNTFYQKTYSEKNSRKYLGQLDLNARSKKVWQFYGHTLDKLASYGVIIVRLDAFAYLHKEPGRKNFLNRPETWQYLDTIRNMAEERGMVVFPEIHAEYGSAVHREVAGKGYPIYDFFFPGLIIDALERHTSEPLVGWIHEIVENSYTTINMLGCHDGIPVLDLKGMEVNGTYNPGLLSDDQVNAVVNLITSRGGLIKNLYGPDGEKISYYQVNATFFSALGESEDKLRLARAIQLFMPGTPQIWYLDLFTGKNNYEAVKEGGEGSHKEINRTNLTLEDIENGLKEEVVLDQLEMIRLRNSSPAFNGKMELIQSDEPHILEIRWRDNDNSAIMKADLKTYAFHIEHTDSSGNYQCFSYNQ